MYITVIVVLDDFCTLSVSVRSPLEKTRYDTSLGLLTKKFVGLIKNAPDGVGTSHYENRPRKKFGCKNGSFHWKIFDIFLVFAQNIDCGYTLEHSKIRKIGIPLQTPVILKVGFAGVFIAWICFPDGLVLYKPRHFSILLTLCNS